MMKISFFKTSKYLLLLLFFSFSLSAEEIMDALYRPPTKVTPLGAFDLEFTYSQFNSSGYYDDDAAAQSFIDDASFSKTDLEGIVTYGFSEKLEFAAGLRVRQNNSVLSNSEELSTSGAESYLLRAKYTLNPYRALSLAFDFRFRSTLYSNPESYDANEMIPGDAGNEISFGGHISYRRVPGHYLTLYGAFNIPADKLSNEIVYNVESAWPYTNWLFALGLNGIKSMNQDPYTETPTTKPAKNTGSTHLYNSINRELMAPYIGIYRAFTNWRIGLNISSIYAGRSTDQGMEYLVSLRRVGSTETAREKDINKFREYDYEGLILKVSPRKKFIKVNLGEANDVKRGDSMDVYATDLNGKEFLVCSGRVYEVGLDWSIVKIEKNYRELDLKKGFIVRGKAD